MDLLDRLGIEHPVVQAAMGGGLSGARLAATFAAELREARERAGRCAARIERVVPAAEAVRRSPYPDTTVSRLLA